VVAGEYGSGVRRMFGVRCSSFGEELVALGIKVVLRGVFAGVSLD
jgi:hypothetical protein